MTVDDRLNSIFYSLCVSNANDRGGEQERETKNDVSSIVVLKLVKEEIRD